MSQIVFLFLCIVAAVGFLLGLTAGWAVWG